MGIMGCYPDERAIENELGGKWVELFAETRETTGNVGYEFPTDIDGSPLNLNGVMVIIGKSTAIATVNSNVSMSINGQAVVNSNIINANDTKLMTKLVLRNGLTDIDVIRASVSNSIVQDYKTFNGVYKFFDNISAFTFSANNIESGSTVRIFVLRGV